MAKQNRLQNLIRSEITKADLVSKSELRSELASFKTEFKSEMVNYIGPVFQELKTQIHGQTILMEQMDKKIDTALEASTSVLRHERIVSKLDRRVCSLENDVKVMKLVRKNDKS